MQIIFESNPSGVELYKFMQKHATTPFKIQKPIQPLSSEGVDPTIAETVPETEAPVSSQDARDEL